MSREVPEGWAEATVADVAAILDSRRVPLNSGERQARKGAIPYWGANGVVDYIDGYLFDEPLVLMAEDGGYFDDAASRPICHRLDGKAWVNNHAHVIRPTSVERDWFYYWFVHRDITPHIKGGTRSKLNQKDLKQLPILVPPLAEQRRIAEILSSVDEAIQTTQAVLEQTRRIKVGVVERLLSRGIGHTQFVQTVIGEIPTTWRVKHLGDVIRLTSGKSKSVRALAREFSEQTPFPVYGGNGVAGYDSEFLIDGANIVMGRVGEYCGAVHRIDGKAWVTDNALYTKGFLEPVNPDFIAFVLAAIPLERIRGGGGQPLISQKPIYEIEVGLPPLDEQHRIAEAVNSLDDRHASSSFIQLVAIKAALMSDLLTGRKRVTTDLPLAAE